MGKITIVRPNKLKVLVFPKDNNPYQELLYRPLENIVQTTNLYKSPPTIAEKIFITPLMLMRLAYYKLRGFNIIHIHWLYPFSLPTWLPLSNSIALINTILFLKAIQILKIKPVWTVHNLLPHAKITSKDLYIRQTLSRMAAYKIVHSSETTSSMKAMGMCTENTVVVPMGNYADAHQNVVSRSKAREFLNIPKNDFVILFFGAIRSGKGVDELISAFIEANLPGARLIIAGKCRDSQMAQRIRYAATQSRIDFYNDYIADEDVSKYIKSCDIFCAPFTENTTSSSVILAMSLRRAAIAPRLGTLKDLPGTTGFYYDPLDSNGLIHSLQHTYKYRDQIITKANNAYSYIIASDWGTSARKTYNIFHKVESTK